MRLALPAFLLLAALSVAPLLTAGPARAQTATVDHPWARATAPHAETGAVFATVTAGTDDRLTGASTPVAEKVEVHVSMEHDGVMHMHELTEGLGLPAGKPVTLAPGGLHLMLIGLKRPLQPGDTFPITLTFASEPPLTVTVAVSAAGAMDHTHVH